MSGLSISTQGKGVMRWMEKLKRLFEGKMEGDSQDWKFEDERQGNVRKTYAQMKKI